MDEPINKTNTLLMNGIFLRDLDHVEKRVLQQPECLVSIPTTFKSVSTWPTFSTLLCWTCSENFDGYPKFIPIYPHKDVNGDDICTTLGNFCDWGCAVRYAQREIPSSQVWDTIRFISLFEQKFSGVAKTKIPPSVPKVVMAKYCGRGGVTLEKWREMNKKNSQEHTILKAS